MLQKLGLTLLVISAGADLHAACINSGSALTATTSITNISCTSNDGSITVNAVNGFVDAAAINGTGYSYAITAGPVTRPTQSNQVFSSLPVGTYTVSITDCNATTIFRTAVVGGTAPAALSYAPVLYRSICASNNGIKVAPAGGRGPYTISVVTAPAGSTPVISGDTIKGLAAGTLSLQITDACGTTLGATTTIATNYPVNNANTTLHYGGCSGIVGDLYHNISTPYINYSMSLAGPVNTSLVVDSFYTQLYFNNALMQTISPNTVQDLVNSIGSAGMTFTGYGPGIYTLRTYARCAGLIKTDSVVIGNRPATTPGTNTNLGGNGLTNNNSARATNIRCSDWDFGYTVARNGWGTADVPRGTVIDVINPVYKIKVISGASHVGDSVYSTNTYQYTALVPNLAFSGTPYAFEISDECGQRDTVYFTQPAPVFTKRPTATASCDGASSVLNANNPLLARGNNMPKVYPITYTFLSGPPIPWVTPSYPIIVVDSVGNAESLNIRLQAVTTPGTYTVAYENGCGQQDTTVWTLSCAPSIPGTVTSSVVSHCGNRGDITLTNAVSDTRLSVSLSSGPGGHTISNGTILSNASSAATFLNQPSGTYVFRGVMGINSVSTLVPYYTSGSGNITAANTVQYGFPLFRTGQTQTSFSYPGPIDTSKLRIYDTFFTVVVPNTNLSIAATESYLCADGSSSANIFAHPGGSVSPYNFAFSYSTTGSSGPWSTPVTDSLMTISSIAASSPVWVRVTDVCGSTAISNSTVGAVSSNTLTSCNSGIAEIVPNPYSRSFIYELSNKATNATTTYSYGTPITIDLNNPANAGTYRLSYRLASGGFTGCVVDFVDIITSSPCSVVLPVELLQFTGKADQNITLLSWTTASEQQAEKFIIERSRDGKQWADIGSVRAAGTSTVPMDYRFSDQWPFAGKNYYRLRIIDRNGSQRYSSVQIVAVAQDNQQVVVAPNPSNGQFRIMFGMPLSEQVTIQIKNSVGQLVYTKMIPENSTAYSVDLGTMPQGVYLVNIEGINLKRKVVIK